MGHFDYDGVQAPLPAAAMTLDLKYDAASFMGTVADRVALGLIEDLKRDITKSVRERVTAAIDSEINAIVRETLERQFQPVDTYGERVGEPTTVKAILAKKAEAFLSEKVDNWGKTSTSGYGDRTTRAEYLLKQLYEAQFNTAIAAEVKKLVDAAKSKAQLSIAKQVVEHLSKGM